MPQANSWGHKRKLTKKKICLAILIITAPKHPLSLTTISLSVLMLRVHHPKETSHEMKKEGPLNGPVLCDLKKNALMRPLRLSFRISNI